MPLDFPKPPGASVSAARNVLESSRAKAKKSEPKNAGARNAGSRKTQPDVSAGLQVYTLDRGGIAPGAGLKRAKAAGWRHSTAASGSSASRPAQAIAIAEREGQHSFHHIDKGWLEPKTAQTIEGLAKLPEVRSERYQVRMLRIPSIRYIDALWLKSKRHTGDLIIPISSSSKELTDGHPYSVREFLRIVRDLASRQVFNNRPRSLVDSQIPTSNKD